MADRDFQVNWIIEPSAAVSGANQIRAALLALEQVVDRLGPKLRDIAKGASTSMGGASRSAKTLSERLGEVDAGAARAGVSLGRLRGGMGQASGGANALGGSLLGIGAATAGVSLVHGAVKALADGLKDARDYAKETAEEDLKLLDSLRELAALRGKSAPDDADAASAVGLMMDAKFKNPDEARKFQQFFEGTIPVAEGKGNLAPAQGTKEDLKADMVRTAARLAVAKGIDPQTAAKLSASVATGQKVTSSDQVTAQLGLMIDNLNAAPDEVSALSRQVLNVRGSMLSMGFADSLPDIASLITTVDINNPAGRSGTRLESVVTDLSKATAGEKKGELAKLGITPDNRNLATVLKNLKPVIDKANAPGGPGALAALRELGFTQSRAIIESVKAVQEIEFLDKQLANNKEVLSSPEKVKAKAAQVNKDLDGFDASTVGQDRAADGAQQAARIERGKETRNLQVLRKFATAEATKKGWIDTPWSSAIEKLGDWNPLMIGAEPARDRTLDGIIQGHLMETVPNASERFGARLAQGKDLAEMINKLSPAERQALAKKMEAEATIPVKSRNQAGMGGPAAAGAAGRAGGAGGPRADLGPAGGGRNPQLDSMVTEQRRTNQILAGLGRGPGPLPDAGGGAMPGRA